MIEPIDSAARRAVEDETQRYVALASDLLDYPFEAIHVQFDLRGRAAGMFKAEGRRRWLRFNPWIFAKYYDEHFSGTIPHEVAHYIVHELYGFGVRPHGQEWRGVMGLFEADPGVTFNADLSGVPQRRQRTHRYRCDCREHEVSSTRHNRVMRGTASYLCRYCNAELRYDP
ncbi:MAG: SprT-like domain-containing protein [Pseudomonadota bacterium]